MPASATRHRLAATVLLASMFLAACQTARGPDTERAGASRVDPPERPFTEHAVPRGPHHIYARDYPLAPMALPVIEQMRGALLSTGVSPPTTSMR
jgi:predicted small secreted protein